VSADLVTLERHDQIGILTLNRPDAANALDMAMSEALMDAAIVCDRNDAIRAVLLRATGRFFCVGGDIGSFAKSTSEMSGLLLRETALLHSAVSRLARMNKPLITEVQGFAAGAGFSLAMLGDIVIASEAAQFMLAYTDIGLTPDGGATWLLPRLVGMRRAQEMLLLNPRLDAQAAFDSGLVTEVVGADVVSTRALAVAEQLACGPTAAYGRIRAQLLASFVTGFEAHLELEARGIADSGATADGAEGVTAFMDKRKAEFRGL
jgi:2-(1,2-epoxy-1,2-dihydrophenyl)acetyl-CoA isomerase